MGQKTALGSLLKSIGNSGQGKVVPGWGAVPVMAFIGVLLLIFLVIMLQIYNQSLLLQGFSVDWNGWIDYILSSWDSPMNIFGVGLPEIAVIAGLALVIFGPKRLPELGRTIGKTLKGLQSASTEFEREIKNAMTEEESSNENTVDKEN